jgi:hypothetical protein
MGEAASECASLQHGPAFAVYLREERVALQRKRDVADPRRRYSGISDIDAGHR